MINWDKFCVIIVYMKFLVNCWFFVFFDVVVYFMYNCIVVYLLKEIGFFLVFILFLYYELLYLNKIYVI